MVSLRLSLALACGALVASLAPPSRSLQRPRAAPSAPKTVAFAEGDGEGGGMIMGGGFNAAGEPPVKIRGFSLAKAALAAGVTITGASLFTFFTSGDGAGISSIGFIYGIPILLIGASLQYAELEPVPVTYEGSEANGERLWEAQANENLLKIRDDVTRHRYGDEAHLDTTLKALGLCPPGKGYPQMDSLIIGGTDNLEFTMTFASPETPYTSWAEPARVRKYATFFGPDVSAEVLKVDPAKRLVAIKLVHGGAPPAPAADDAEGA